MSTDKPKSRARQNGLHILFIIVAAALLFFLLKAPAETTPKLPHDETHEPFYKIESKKEAEKSCAQCHSENGIAPLSEKHPPKYRCLFCHKRD